MTFPNTAVLYLRANKKTPDKMKYENVQKGAGDMMSGALIETGAGKLKNEANSNQDDKKREMRLSSRENNG